MTSKKYDYFFRRQYDLFLTPKSNGQRLQNYRFTVENVKSNNDIDQLEQF